jgi:hypothetical protein
MSERLQFPLHSVQFGKYRHAFGKHGASGERKTILRQISGGGAFGNAQSSVIEGVKPGQNLHQGRFAGAVGAHQADAVARRDQPVGVLKKEFVAESFSGARKLNHGLDSSSHKLAAARRIQGKRRLLLGQIEETIPLRCLDPFLNSLQKVRAFVWIIRLTPIDHCFESSHSETLFVDALLQDHPQKQCATSSRFRDALDSNKPPAFAALN